MKNFKRIYNILSKKEAHLFSFFILCAFIISLLEIFSLGLAIPIVGYATNENLLDSNSNLNKIFDFSKNIDLLLILFFITYVFKILFTLLTTYLKEKFIFKTSLRISQELFKIYISQPFIFIQNFSPSNLIRNLTHETNNFTALLNSVIIMFSEIIVLLIIFIFLLIFNFKITLILTFIILATSLAYNKFFRKKIKNWAIGRQDTKLKMISSLDQGIKCIREIKLLSKEKFIQNKFYSEQLKGMSYDVKINLVQHSPRLFFEFAIIVSILIMLYFGLKSNTTINLFSTLSIFILSAVRFIPSSSKMISALQNYRFNISSVELFEKEFKLKKSQIIILNHKFSIKNVFEKNIVFSNVSFAYDSGQKIFENINVTIKKNEKILIMGESGSGKSTMLDLAAGLIKPTSGKIFLDDKINLSDAFHNWKSKIGFVAQRNYFLNESIINNIAFGQEKKLINQEKIIKICSIIGLSELIENLPEGLNTSIGEDGTKFSGGQLQRVAIARALYTDPAFIIMDEGTSALDEKNESLVLEYLKNLNVTVIFSSHKKNHGKYFDRIYNVSNKKLESIN